MYTMHKQLITYWCSILFAFLLQGLFSESFASLQMEVARISTTSTMHTHFSPFENEKQHGNYLAFSKKFESDSNLFTKEPLAFICQKLSIVAAKSTVKLLNGPINLTQKGMAHILERHTVNNIAKFAGKSKFNAGEDIAGLITRATQQPMVPQANGNFQRIFNAGRNIGVDRATGQATSTMTVITNRDGDLITAFPGLP